jgi:hypothetical protein
LTVPEKHDRTKLVADQVSMNVIFQMSSAINYKRHMRNAVLVLVLLAIFPAFGQSAKPAYQSGTITAIKTHKDAPPAGQSATRFDVSIKGRDTVYVVLYTPPPGTYGNQYITGMDLLVLVGDKTITYNDLLGVSREVPILSRATASQTNSH